MLFAYIIQQKNGFAKVFTNTKLKISAERCIIRVRKRYGFFAKLRLSKSKIHPIHLTFFLTKPLENLLEAEALMWQGLMWKRETKMPKTLVNTGVSAFLTVGYRPIFSLKIRGAEKT